MNRTDLVPQTVLACCVLHNICIDLGDLDNEYMREGHDFLQNNDDGHDNNGFPEEDLHHYEVYRRDYVAQQLHDNRNQ